MRIMPKRRPPPADSPSPGDDPGPKKRPPSREKVRYVAIPVALYQLLEQYAADHSDQDDAKSISWAARKGLRTFLENAGYRLQPPPKGGKQPEE